MYEWSEMDQAVAAAVRQFVDAEIRPRRDEFEFGDTPPYEVIRKLFKTFGIDAMATDALNKILEKERSGEKVSGSLTGGGDQGSMGVVLVKELCRVSPGFVGCIGVSLGLAAATIMARGTLAQKERWLPSLVTFDKVGAWAITLASRESNAGLVR